MPISLIIPFFLFYQCKPKPKCDHDNGQVSLKNSTIRQGILGVWYSYICTQAEQIKENVFKESQK